MHTRIQVLAEDENTGVLETMPGWALLLIGVGLILVAGAFWLINQRLKEDSFILDIAGILCGIGGLVSIWQGLFGS